VGFSLGCTTKVLVLIPVTLGAAIICSLTAHFGRTGRLVVSFCRCHPGRGPPGRLHDRNDGTGSDPAACALSVVDNPSAHKCFVALKASARPAQIELQSHTRRPTQMTVMTPIAAKPTICFRGTGLRPLTKLGIRTDRASKIDGLSYQSTSALAHL